jgi:Fe(3+) dicitrate transport protein
LGKGTTGSDYDLTLVDPLWGRDMHFKTKNLAVFAENRFQFLNNLSVNAGARIEMGNTDLSGTITYYPGNDIPVSISHEFPLLGAGFSYKPVATQEVYGGISQAYHPVLFKDLVPGSLYEKVDPDIKDAKGYNAELGFRGSWRFLRWDVSGYLLAYRNRFGTLAETDAAGNFYTYRTNIGNSFTRGLELFLQADWFPWGKTILSVFTSTAFQHARYRHATLRSGSNNIDVSGNKVESVPNLITRNGISWRYRKVSVAILYSYTASSFADAFNTVEPMESTGAVGLVPAYGILDLNTIFRVTRDLEIRISPNNLAEKSYFTKRPTFYPGPGVWPSDGRNGALSVVIRI